MKIESVRIKNLRSFRDETINFNDYTCLVGPNGSGKSTVLYALNIFFHEKSGVSTDTANLDKEDFHNKNTDEPIEITITFVGLSEEAQIDFSNYYRQGKLIVSAVAVYDQAIGKAPVRQVGKRLVMPAFKEFFKALGNSANVPELTELYNNIREHINLPIPGTKTKMIDALHQYENEHPELCELLDSDDQFYGVTKGANKLEKYLQWVYVPAVKDASGEQIETKNTALGRLLARTVRSKANFSDSVSRIEENAHSQYQRLLDENQYILNDLSQSLKRRLSDWAHPEAMVKLEWWRDPDKSVKIEEPFAKIIAGEGAFEGELARFGHGLQRSYLLALLHELASVEDVVDSQLILGCEEPELYQHPPQARHLSTVLQKLSNGNAQIIVATHSPAFVSGDGFENVRMVRKNTENRRSNVFGANYSNICADIAEATGETPRSVSGTIAKIHQVLQPALNEMFFTSRLVLVEGLEDVAYLSAYLHLLDRWEDFRRIGCHFVPTNGKSELVRPLVIARRLKIPTYIVFDSDGDKKDRNGTRDKHEKDNKALLTLVGSAEEALPTETVWGCGFVMWASDIGAVVKTEIGDRDWEEYCSRTDAEYGHVGGLRKNTLHIASTLALAWDDGKRSVSLERACESILNPAQHVAYAGDLAP